MVRATGVAAAFVTLLALASGCGDDTADTGGTTTGGVSCKLEYLGDAESPIELRVFALGADDVARELAAGGEVAMILPPQGGRVIFVGAVATNIDPCAVKLSGSLRDTTSNQIRVDERTTNLKPTAEAGWGGPVDTDISTFSNIPLCPNQWATTAMYDNPFDLTLTITDRAGRSATQTLSVIPVCGEPEFEAECLCQCQAGYELGQACP